MTEGEGVALRIGDGRDWHFVNGDWVDGGGGALSVPEDIIRSEGPAMEGHHYAFYRAAAYRDVTLRFEFMQRGHTNLGVVLRATDESHFYLLHFPCCGQARRSQHFWAALSRMDESGYLKCVKLDMVRRVPSNIGQWVPVELTLSGPRITVRIGEHGFFEAEDDTYAGPGCLGVFLCSFYESGFGIRNVVVDGAPVSESPWREDVRQPTNWFYPVPTSEDVWQSPASLLRFPGGELLLIYGVQGEGGTDKYPDERARPIVRHVRSTDGGHTWSQPEDEVVLGGVWPTRGAAHLTPGGRLIRLFDKDEQWLTAESPDRGRTWLQPVPVDIGPMPPHARQLYMGPQAFLNLADGSMVLFLYASHDLAAPDLTHNNWGAVHWQGFACRSTDDGHTWSAAVNLDNSARDPEDQLYDNLDLTEACSTQMSDGRILALIRPESSQWMWETWSRDGGATWGPCVRGPFPGYATPNMVRTSSGAVLVAHRLPTMSIHCSLDEGHIWDHGTIIDNAIWCMGSMCAVEPDLVLYCYMDTFERLMRAQFLRVTPAGLEPAPPGLGG